LLLWSEFCYCGLYFVLYFDSCGFAFVLEDLYFVLLGLYFLCGLYCILVMWACIIFLPYVPSLVLNVPLLYIE
jgi:hypothetical protein